MKIEERLERAWVLSQMRKFRRAPRWLDDKKIMAALELDLIAIPKKIRKCNRRRTAHVKSICTNCGKTNVVGCASCWGADIETPSELDQIGILRAAQNHEVIPRWLPDAALSRAYKIRRSVVAAKIFDADFCESCGDLHASVCLRCLLLGNSN